MTKQRTFKDHPAADADKPSLVRREALLEELRRATEALKPSHQLEDARNQWQEAQKALQEALKPSQQLEDVRKQWQEAQKALQEALAPSKKYLDAINKAQKIAGVSGKHEED